MAVSPACPGPIPSARGIGGEAGWRAFGSGQHPSAQTGAFDGTLLNQLPANIPGVQLWNGVAGMTQGWYFPSRSVVPSFQQTQQMVNLAGAQRRGSMFTGPIGPVSARLYRARVTAAAVPQTSLLSQPWAQLLLHRSDDQ